MTNSLNSELYELLEENYQKYHRPAFIDEDPISIPHHFSKKEDIEIAAFLVAIISWGQRKTILKNGHRLIQLMDHSPRDFIMQHKENDLKSIKNFVHRTFNSIDLAFFFRRLQQIYLKEGGLESLFCGNKNSGIKDKISAFKVNFFTGTAPQRTKKHIANPNAGSSAKRLNMFLRWMVRTDAAGVDFKLWKSISPKELMLPLDVHTAKVGRSLGLLQRKQNDWRAVEEITENLRKFDSEDPVKYDFALFGLGVNKTI